MSDLSGIKEDKKLDWMYRDASQIVDREEYLLGRKIDKQFEASVLPPGKEQECLPPSIFSSAAAESQVDIARKLQEDPLYLIKKKEIECREQLLKNPRKMKQLQEMIARQQAAAKKLKRKEVKKKKKKDLDVLLVKKCKKLFGGEGTKKLTELDESDSETSSSSNSDGRASKKKNKKKKERKNLDRLLAVKYKKVLGNLDARGLAEMDFSSDSSSEDKREKKLKRKKDRSLSSSSDERHKQNLRKPPKRENARERKLRSSEEEIEEGKKVSKTLAGGDKRKGGSKSREQSRSGCRSKLRGSEDTYDACNRKMQSRLKENSERVRIDKNMYEFNHEDKYDKRNTNERDKLSSRSYNKNRSNVRECSEREETKISSKNNSYDRTYREGARHIKKENLPSRSSSESSSYGKSKSSGKSHRRRSENAKDIQIDASSVNDIRDSKKTSANLKYEVSKHKPESPTSSSSECSSEERQSSPKKQYGLVLPSNYVPKQPTKEEIKQKTIKEEESSRSFKKEDKRKLTNEEKERKLKEMMDNAKWRDEQRDKNIKAFKEKEKAEKDDYVYNEDFMRKQMALAVSQGTVESRVKANINTIQRSGVSMSENFARRN